MYAIYIGIHNKPHYLCNETFIIYYNFFSMGDLAGNFYVVPRNIIISLILLLRILRTDKNQEFFYI